MRSSMTGSIALTCLWCAGQAPATDWASPISGNWNDSANWNPADVPDTPAEVAQIVVAGTYTVELSNPSTQVGGLLLINPNATLSVDEGARVRYYGADLTNNGAIVVNQGGGEYPTSLSLESAACLVGGT